jgi:hypothetical protein
MSRIVLITLMLSAIVADIYCAEKPQFTKSAAVSAANRKALKSLHQKLDKAKVENDVHDACIRLIQIGDDTSIPHLIGALRLFPDGEPGPNVGMICTQLHCVEALKRITGENVGFGQFSWKSWYDSRYKNDNQFGSKEGGVSDSIAK